MPESCPKCGSPVRRGRTTSLDFETGETYDSGGYVFYFCGGLLASGPGSPACKIIASMRPVVEAAARWRDLEGPRTNEELIDAQGALDSAVDAYREGGGND